MTCTFTRNKEPSLTMDDLREAKRKLDALQPKIHFHVSPYHPSPGMVYVVKPPNLPFDFLGDEKIESVVVLHAKDKRRFLRLCAEYNIEAIPLGPHEVEDGETQ
jgi:hypothetical protein